MKTPSLLYCTAVLVTILSISIGKATAQLTKPAPITGAIALNNFVSSIFDVYDNVNAIQMRINALQTALLNKPVLDVNPQEILEELKNCSDKLADIVPALSNLLAASADMPTKARAELTNKPLRIPAALVQLKICLKALKETEGNVSLMLKTTIPAIKAKLPENRSTDTSINLTGQIKN